MFSLIPQIANQRTLEVLPAAYGKTGVSISPGAREAEIHHLHLQHPLHLFAEDHLVLQSAIAFYSIIGTILIMVLQTFRLIPWYTTARSIPPASIYSSLSRYDSTLSMFFISFNIYAQFQEHRPNLAEHIRTCSERPSVAFSQARRFQPEVRPDWTKVNIEKVNSMFSLAKSPFHTRSRWM